MGVCLRVAAAKDVLAFTNIDWGTIDELISSYVLIGKELAGIKSHRIYAENFGLARQLMHAASEAFIITSRILNGKFEHEVDKLFHTNGIKACRRAAVLDEDTIRYHAVLPQHATPMCEAANPRASLLIEGTKDLLFAYEEIVIGYVNTLISDLFTERVCGLTYKASMWLDATQVGTTDKCDYEAHHTKSGSAPVPTGFQVCS